ncbi:MAG: PAAR-like domain-containing protein [Campylobacterota bacterium]|nr:PAAR-like domain-containing protein [Campylobacterota bacterium]
MYQITTEDAANIAEPDVCMTVTPDGPIPIPYPNMSSSSNVEEPIETIIVDGGNVLNMMSEISSSEGDEEGIEGGVVSEETGSMTRYTLGSETLFLKGSPAVKLTSSTAQNGEIMNAEGACIEPSQEILSVMS